MNREQTIKELEALRDIMISEMPEDCSLLKDRIQEWMDYAQKHVNAMYNKNMEVGLGFCAMEEHYEKENYQF